MDREHNNQARVEILPFFQIVLGMLSFFIAAKEGGNHQTIKFLIYSKIDSFGQNYFLLKGDNIMDEVLQKTSQGHKIGSSGAGIAILLFFFPWLIASCQGQEIARVSGWELAVGFRIGTGLGSERVSGITSLLLVLVAAIIVIALAYFALKRDGELTEIDAYGPMAASVIAVLVLIFTSSSFRNEANQSGIQVDFLFWYYLVYLCFIAVFYGGYLNLQELKKTNST